MLSNTDISTTIIAPVLTELLSEFGQSVYVIEDNQDIPRPLDQNGYVKNYLFYKVLPLKQLDWPKEELKNTNKQKMIGQYELTVKLNILGVYANDISNYLVNTIASIHGDIAFKRGNVELYYNTITDPVDLTEIENTKWIKRVSRDLVFGYQDENEFTIDSFNEINNQMVIDNGVTQKVIIVKTKGDNNGI